MAQVIIDVPNSVAQRVLDAVCYLNGYTDQVSDGQGGLINNPITKVVFAKQQAANWLKASVATYEVSQAVNSARDAAIAKTNGEVILS